MSWSSYNFKLKRNKIKINLTLKKLENVCNSNSTNKQYINTPKGQEGLKKLPYTIPDLVSLSPRRTKEGYFYTGENNI